LQAQLAAHKTFSSVSFCVLHNPPEIETSLQQVSHALAQSDEPTILMGHSVGVQAAMRATTLHKVAGLFGVAGWWGVDQPWPTLLPWMQTTFAHEKVIENAAKRFILLSDNDPFTANASETQQLFQSRIQAQTKIIPGGKHFNQSEEPAVLDALLDFVR
jgi:predicted alpha/beta hydrolase family esterase